ncbi:hypothetical protein [Glaciecola sp. MF2-115]|uniref:hypothetical protein n=1 Tax=Glaciecola sp. MF2-115 TaxID=3384827 RepID=UPI0039A15E13
MKTSIYFFIALSFISNKSDASEPFIPISKDFVVAQWATKTTEESFREQLVNLLEQAIYPGNSANYSIASSLLAKASSSDLSEAQKLYFDAVIQQHYHRFEESKLLLLRVLQIDPGHVNATLLLSNIYSVLGDAEMAKKMCVQLLLSTDQTIVATCALNAAAQDGKLTESVKQLSMLLENQVPKDDELSIWITEVYASLVKANGNTLMADQLLSPFLDKTLPLSFWVLWSDIQLELARPTEVMSQVQKVVNASNVKDDALILRLAIAEQEIGAKTSYWRSQAKARVDLREARQDKEHAFDIALYYFHIEQNYEVAHQWALVNWQQAKLLEDKDLLSMTQTKIQTTLVSKTNQGTLHD